jgi:antitoxin VapB
MAMNIKNPETYRLAKELAALTGESLTTAVTEAVRERLERVRHKPDPAKVERLMAIARKMAPLMKEPWKSTDHGELLYDEKGLPR